VGGANDNPPMGGNPLGEQPMNYWQPAIVALRATYLPAYYLCAYKAPDIYVPIIYVLIKHYICRESSTNSPLFMQNKPNLPDAQMNVRSAITVDYENKSNWKLGENKANSKPIQSQSNPIFTKNPEKPAHLVRKLARLVQTFTQFSTNQVSIFAQTQYAIC
jgi:hypothetical protein